MPGIPENITIAGRTPATIKGNLPPLIDTAEAARGGFRAGDDTGGGDVTWLFFSDNFDDQADWNGAQNGANEQYADLHTLPTGWDSARSTPGYSPSAGYSDGVESNYVRGGAEFTRGETGKSYVAYRGGREAGAYWTDSILGKTLPQGTKKVFVRFWIKFQPNWTEQGYSKLFRIQGWEEGTNSWNSTSLRPGIIWGFVQTTYGSRNQLSYRSTDGDSFTNPTLPNTREQFDWATDSYRLDRDGVINNYPELINQTNAQVIQEDHGLVDHKEIMGTAWHKMEFYVEMNSEPGATDGVFAQWLDGQIIHRNLVVPWIQADGDAESDWRLVKLGGNDSFTLKSVEDDQAQILNSEEIMEWCAFDDVEIYIGGLPNDVSMEAIPQ